MESSREMFLSRLKMQHSEQIPVFLRDLTLALDVTNAKTTEVFTRTYDPELSADSIIAFQRYTGQDAVVGCIQSAAFNVESFGGTMKYPEYGIPVPLTHPFEGMNDVPEDLDIRLSDKMLGAVRSYSLVRIGLPDQAVVANVEGPLTKTGTLTGLDYLAILLIEEKDLAEKFISVSMEHTDLFLERLHADASMDSVFLAAATDNPDLFGPEIYIDFSLKHSKEMTDHSHSLGYPVIFHPHGDFSVEEHKDIFDMTVEMGIDGFQFAEQNQPSLITSRIDGRCAVLGGTNVVPTLLYGSDEEITSETEYYVDACDPGSHIFMPSCSLHRGTDLRRVSLMVQTVRGHSG